MKLILALTFSLVGFANAQNNVNSNVGFNNSLSTTAEKQEDKTFLVAGINTALGVGFIYASSAAKSACKSGTTSGVAQAEAAKVGATGDDCILGTILDMMAMGSFMQAATGLTDSLVSGLTKSKSRNDPGLGGAGGGPNPDDPSDTHNDETIPVPNITLPNGQTISGKRVNPAKELAKLEAQGYKINKATGAVTTPNGKTFSSSAVKSAAQSMAASDPNFKQTYDSLMAQAEAAASSGFKAIRMDTDSSGGGGGARPVSNNRAVSSYSGFKWPGFDDGKPKAASVAGLTKMANGEPIGVAQDDIFKMMQRAYGSRQGHGMFIEE